MKSENGTLENNDRNLDHLMISENAESNQRERIKHLQMNILFQIFKHEDRIGKMFFQSPRDRYRTASVVRSIFLGYGLNKEVCKIIVQMLFQSTRDR